MEGWVSPPLCFTTGDTDRSVKSQATAEPKSRRARSRSADVIGSLLSRWYETGFRRVIFTALFPAEPGWHDVRSALGYRI